MSKKSEAIALLEEAADLAHSVWAEDRETGWCQDVESGIRKALAILKPEEPGTVEIREPAWLVPEDEGDLSGYAEDHIAQDHALEQLPLDERMRNGL